MITSLVISFSGTVSYTDGSTGHFHGESLPDGSSFSAVGSDGFKVSDNIRWSGPPYTWNTVMELFFEYLSWSIASAQLNPTAQAAAVRKVVDDLVVRFVVKCSTDGNNVNANYAFPPWGPNPGLGSGTHFEIAQTYQFGSRVIEGRNLQADALLSEITGDAGSLATFQSVLDSALESVNLTIV
jgi:hypothetical protein